MGFIKIQISTTINMQWIDTGIWGVMFCLEKIHMPLHWRVIQFKEQLFMTENIHLTGDRTFYMKPEDLTR